MSRKPKENVRGREHRVSNVAKIEGKGHMDSDEEKNGATVEAAVDTFSKTVLPW